MTNNLDVPGTYVVDVTSLIVHGTLETGENNRVFINGMKLSLTSGKEFPVYEIKLDKQGWTWGRITPDGAEQHHYVCLYDLNRRFAHLLNAFPVPVVNTPFTISITINLGGVNYSGILIRA